MREYTATITQSGSQLDVVLSGADFIVIGGRGDRFSGIVDAEDRVTFAVGHDDGSFYYFYTAQWDVVERLTAANALVAHGTVTATASSTGIFGTLAGAINLSAGTTPPFGPFQAYCRGRHGFDMVRR
jgi:hypothetical protein